MPLKKGCSRQISLENYKKLLREGYPKAQAYGISLGSARKCRSSCGIRRKKEIEIGRAF